MDTTNEDRSLAAQILQGHEDSSRSGADHGISRRSFLHAGALAGGSAALGSWSAASAQQADGQTDGNNDNGNPDHVNLDIEIAGASIAKLQELLSSGSLSS